jgi:hypothetical protein
MSGAVVILTIFDAQFWEIIRGVGQKIMFILLKHHTE